MAGFDLQSAFSPAGDQPKAIEGLTDGVRRGLREQVLLGVTGSGKTFSVASVIQQVQRPTLVLSPNKTLAAQLWAEFREFFPNNAVEYFVSFYDYYQPEAYMPRTDTYIEKDSTRNDEIDRLRNSATQALLTRRDVIVVASISCIYGIGSPENYLGESVSLKVGETIRREILLRKLAELQYVRSDMEFSRSKFRVRGDTIDIWPAHSEIPTRVELNGDGIEKIREFDYLTGEILGSSEEIAIFPATHYVTPAAKMQRALQTIEEELEHRERELIGQGKLLEAQRLSQRTNFDLEMLRETGTCAGIENYSRHLSGRQAGERPDCLLDFLPDDSLVVVDESHVAVPQIGGMFGGDRARKIPLVEYGFRLPSAMDNRPLTFAEWDATVGQIIYASATPGDYELNHSLRTVEQIIRPTFLPDPVVSVKPAQGQIDDLMVEIGKRVAKKERTLITTLTKKMAEDLTDYLREGGIKVRYLHSDIDTLERVEIIRDLRLGVFDVLVGINLLREGLDLPEVSFIGILDADKEGFLRGYRSLIQTIGRAARHVEGRVTLYADRNSDAMVRAIGETERRRKIQIGYNDEHGVQAQSIVKAVYQMEGHREERDVQAAALEAHAGLPIDELLLLARDVEKQMKRSAKDLDFERAAELRDRLGQLRQEAAEMTPEGDKKGGTRRGGRPTRRRGK